MPDFPLTLTASAEAAGQRLDQYLATQLSEINKTEVSRARVQQLIAKGEVLVNGAAAKASLRLKATAKSRSRSRGRRTLRRCAPLRRRLRLTSFMRTTTWPSSTSPPGMMVHAGAGATDDARNRGTLVNALLHHFAKLSAVGGELRPGSCIAWIGRPAG